MQQTIANKYIPLKREIPNITKGGIKIKHQKTIIILLIMITLVVPSCVNAHENNTTYFQELKSSQDSINNSDILESPSQSYLVLDNDADKENVYLGDQVTWILSVINYGPDTAKNVKVLIQLPDGMTFLKQTATQGSFNPKTGIWTIGDLSVDAGEVFLNILTKTVTPGEKINKATLTTDSINLNENNSFEEEEMDVFEKLVQTPVFSKSAHTEMHPTGNPISLILVSLFGAIIISLRNSKK